MRLLSRHGEAPDRAAAALRWLPPLVGLMTGLFAVYVLLLVNRQLGFTP